MAVIERRLDDSEDHDKRIAVIESVVVALKDLPIIAAKLDVLVESTMRRIELIEQHVFTKHNHQ